MSFDGKKIYTTLVYVNATTPILNRAEFNFDNKYEFHMEPLENEYENKYVLSAKKRENPIPDNFWGENISSLNVIAGKNGAGKTSFLNFVMNNIGSGTTTLYGENVFYILRYGNQYIYAGNYMDDCLVIDSSFEKIRAVKLEDAIFNNGFVGDGTGFGNESFWKNYIFYSNCFGSCYERSNSMVIDISMDHWVDDILRRKRPSWNEKEYAIQNELRRERCERTLQFLENDDLQKVAEKIGMHAPKLLVFSLQKNNEIERLRKQNVKFWKNTWVSNERCKRYVQGGFVTKTRELYYESAINYFAVSMFLYFVKKEMISSDTLMEFVSRLSETTDKTGVELAIDLIQQHYDGKKFMERWKVIEVLKMIGDQTAPYVLYWQNNYRFVIRWKEKNIGLVKLLLGWNDSFFNCGLEYEDADGMTSSGEQSRLNLVLSLYEAYNQVEKNKDNLNRSVLLIADEIDAYFHPQFQLSVIADLVKAVNVIFQDYKVQILMTTNTPLEMTDIPNENITYMENGMTKKSPVSEKTFAGNYISLLKNSFFTNSTMGDFSKQKINSVIDFLSEQENGKQKGEIEHTQMTKEEARYVISIIGEPILRNKLMQWYKELFLEEYERND